MGFDILVHFPKSRRLKVTELCYKVYNIHIVANVIYTLFVDCCTNVVLLHYDVQEMKLYATMSK